MFKQLGRFGVLAVCLFAIVIVMVGCNGNGGGGEGGNGNGKGTEIIKPEVETPMEKLAGTYTLVEIRVGNEIIRPPDMSGDLNLYRLSGYPYDMSLTVLGNPLGRVSGTWSADETTITLDGDRSPYSWDGTHLTFAVPTDDGLANVKWRQTTAFQASACWCLNAVGHGRRPRFPLCEFCYAFGS